MRAFRITWDKKGGGNALDLSNAFNLPRVECLDCCRQYKNWGQGMIDYPAFKFEFLNDKEFNDNHVISVEEFDKLRNRIQKAAGRPVMVIPGASIGELSGNSITDKLDDFVWGRILVPQISKRALRLLESDGINLLTSSCSICFRGRKLDSHLAIQVDLAAMMSEENLIRHKIQFCPRCGNYMDPPRPVPVVPEGYLLKRSFWPKNQHLVQMVETLKVIASDEFIGSVKKHKLSGIAFQEYGQFLE